MFVQFGRFLVPMLLTFLRNHPYHYLGKKARPELPNEGPDDPMCCSSTGTSPASSDTGAGKPHLCHLGFKLTSVFPQRDVKSTFMSYNGTAFTWLMQIMPALFGMPVTLDNLAIFPAQVSGCLRLQLQFDYNGSLEGREISTRRLHITRGPGLIPRLGGYDSVVASGICSVARRVWCVSFGFQIRTP